MNPIPTCNYREGKQTSQLESELGLFSVIPDEEINYFSWQGILKPPVLKHKEKAPRTARAARAQP